MRTVVLHCDLCGAEMSAWEPRDHPYQRATIHQKNALETEKIAIWVEISHGEVCPKCLRECLVAMIEDTREFGLRVIQEEFDAYQEEVDHADTPRV